MKTVYPGLGIHLNGDRYFPAVAMNSQGAVLACFADSSSSSANLYMKVCKIHGGDLQQGSSHEYGAGSLPAIALNDAGDYTLLYVQSDGEVHWASGSIDNTTLSFVHTNTGRVNQTTHNSTPPTVALIPNQTMGYAAVQTANSSFLVSRIAHYNNSTSTVNAGAAITGTHPSIAIHPSGRIMIIYVNNSKLCYRLGTDPNPDPSSLYATINWSSEQYVCYVTTDDTGENPSTNHITTDMLGSTPQFSLAFTEDTAVISYHDKNNDVLRALTGTYRIGTPGDIIEWSNQYSYDVGIRPAIAAASVTTGRYTNTYCVQVNEVKDGGNLNYSLSLVADHARWMENLNTTIGGKNLGQITIPASHDAGMYEQGATPVAAQTQSMSMYEQLMYGVRYFDLRIDYDSLVINEDDRYEIYHGPMLANGDNLVNILKGVQNFMANQQGKELVILKFSHFHDFGDANATNSIYQGFTTLITQYLSTYLCEPPEHGRFGTMSINDILGGQGRVMVVCDDNFSINNPCTGIYTYRDGSLDCSTDSDRLKLDPDDGNLVVWDCYSKTTSYDTMKNDQIDKYHNYTGKCTGKTSSNADCSHKICDMFLFSYTLTPTLTSVWTESQQTDSLLSQVMNTIQLNTNGTFVNILYVNYTQYSRTTTISILMAQGLMPVAS